MDDRRRRKRFVTKNGVYTTNTAKPGMIIDVSKEGFALRYIDRKKTPKETNLLTIQCDNSGCCIENIPYEIISDNKMPSEHPGLAPPMRRRAARFGPLTEEQNALLESLLRKCTL